MYKLLVRICTTEEQSLDQKEKVWSILENLGDRRTRYTANLFALLYLYEFDTITAADKLLSQLIKVKEILGEHCQEIQVFCVTNQLCL